MGTLHQRHNRVPTNDAISSHRLHSMERNYTHFYTHISVHTHTNTLFKSAVQTYQKYFNIRAHVEHHNVVLVDSELSATVDNSDSVQGRRVLLIEDDSTQLFKNTGTQSWYNTHHILKAQIA